MEKILKDISIVIPIFIWVLLMGLLYTGRNTSAVIIAIGGIAFLTFIVLDKVIRFKYSLFIPLSFLFYYFIVTLFSPSFSSTTDIVRFIVIYVLLPFSIYYFIPKKSDDLVSLVMNLKGFIGLTAIYSIIEYLGHYNYMVHFVKIAARNWIITMNQGSSYYTSSIFLHYTYFSYVLLVGLCITLIFPYRKTFIELVFRGLILLSIVLSQSRIIWIALVITFLVYFVGRARVKIINFIISIVLIIFFILLGFYFNLLDFIGEFISDRFSSLFKYGLDDGSLGQRWGTLSNWNIYFSDHIGRAIFGLGYGSTDFYLKNYSYFYGYNTADSMITIILVESGIVGALLFIANVVYAFSSISRQKDNFSKLALLILVATLVTSITIDFTANIIILYLFYLVFIVAMIGREQSELRFVSTTV